MYFSNIYLFDLKRMETNLPSTFALSLYALIIGINEYAHPDIYNLNGATTDADTISAFLTQTMSIPSSHITNLRNRQATRSAVIEEIRRFASDHRIKEGDPILIYYAGHGAETLAPVGWEAGGPNARIQMLIPYDFVPEEVATESGQGILDKEFNLLLSYIAEEKGDNITVILDCCHSGSGTRSEDSSILTRGLNLPEGYTIFPNLDPVVSSGARGTEIPSRFARAGLASHVLLAACREDQTAKETADGGIFTAALLDAFNKVGINSVTYEDVVSLLQHFGYDQNPQCEGIHRSRKFFNWNYASPYRNALFPVRRENGDEYILEAGEAHGISEGAEFLVYRHRTLYPDPEQSLGTLIAYRTQKFTTTARLADNSPLLDLPGSAFALQTRSGDKPDLRLYTRNGDIWAMLTNIQAVIKRRRILLVEEGEHSDLVLVMLDGEVVFHFSEKISRTYNMIRMPDSVSLDFDRICGIISSAADFYSYLSLGANTGGLASKVEVQCTTLQFQGMSEDLFPVLVPSGENLVKEGVINVCIDDDFIYGFKVTNKSKLALYISVFYFDISDLSITSYYQPNTGSGEGAGGLRPGGDLTIGYGSGGIQPREFFLRPGQEVDVGFVKLFITTIPVDYSFIPQESPFEETRHGGIFPNRSIPVLAWDTIQLTIVQREGSMASTA
ncbi:caspase domain-containing protein [Crucibulum laeve]|uniref:Caspase domain-containing protein n=1 Tax=Crucibulum laeve TaxID=68775 RepID=A0A5C3LWI4_9AGAR|nr:caspase domain-containing protein [Crucibulum laeve]